MKRTPSSRGAVPEIFVFFFVLFCLDKINLR